MICCRTFHPGEARHRDETMAKHHGACRHALALADRRCAFHYVNVMRAIRLHQGALGADRSIETPADRR